MPNPQPIRFAVVGCGSHAQAWLLPAVDRSEKVSLHTCCDLSEELREHCKKTYHAERTTDSFQEAIDDPEVDAVILATTEKLRLPVIAAAAAAGKAVYVEKPLATTLKEVLEIQRVVHESGIPFCVGHNRRSAPAMLEAHRLFRGHMDNPKPCPWRWKREGENLPDLPDDGVASISVRVNDDWHSWKSWVFDKQQAPHGPMLFEMTHFTDVCNWMLDARPVEVTAVESGMLQHSVIVRYENGEMATLMMTANGTFGYPKELYEMFGRGAAVAIDHVLEVRTAGIEGAPGRVTFPLLRDRHPEVGTELGISGWLAKKRAACEEAVSQGDPMLQFSAEPDKGHAHQIDRFADEIAGRGPEVCGVDDAVLATHVAFAAIESARQHRPVLLEEL